MSKIYVKDSNGKYKLVDRDQKGETKSAEKILAQLSLEQIDARLRNPGIRYPLEYAASHARCPPYT